MRSDDFRFYAVSTFSDLILLLSPPPHHAREGGNKSVYLSQEAEEGGREGEGEGGRGKQPPKTLNEPTLAPSFAVKKLPTIRRQKSQEGKEIRKGKH